MKPGARLHARATQGCDLWVGGASTWSTSMERRGARTLLAHPRTMIAVLMAEPRSAVHLSKSQAIEHISRGAVCHSRAAHSGTCLLRLGAPGMDSNHEETTLFVISNLLILKSPTCPESCRNDFVRTAFIQRPRPGRVGCKVRRNGASAAWPTPRDEYTPMGYRP